MIVAVSRLLETAKRAFSRLRSPATNFSRDYWIFLGAAFCMDIGFGLFFFLFNLYLADLHFNERFIGQTMACLTLGNVAGTIPALVFARRRGLRPLLIVTFLCAPLMCAMRLFFLQTPAQLTIAFLAGAALSGWPICFSPVIAKLTNDKNRAFGFSIAFATGIGLGTVAGVAGGYIPQLLQTIMADLSLVGGIRIVLLSSCMIVLLGLLPLAKLRVDHQPAATATRIRIAPPFLLRFLPGFVLWNAVTGSFAVFGAVYLQNKLGVPLGRIGTVFSASELMQFGAVLVAPMLLERIRIHKGIAVAQLGTSLLLILIAMTRSATLGICFYVLYFAVQYMCEPAIYKLLMDAIPEQERSTASAIQNMSGAACQAAATAITGYSIVRFGYGAVLPTNAGIAAAAAVVFLSLGKGRVASVESEAHMNESSLADILAVGERETLL